MNEDDYILLLRERDNKICLYLLGNLSVQKSTWAIFTGLRTHRSVVTKQNLSLKKIMNMGYVIVGTNEQKTIPNLKELDFTKSYYRMELTKILQSVVNEHPEILL